MKSDYEMAIEDIENCLKKFCPKREKMYRKAIYQIDDLENIDVRMFEGKFQITRFWNDPVTLKVVDDGWHDLIPEESFDWTKIRPEGRDIAKHLFPTFLNYTDAMYFGNEPSRENDSWQCDGKPCMEYSTKYGSAIVGRSNKVVAAQWNLGPKIMLSIIGSTLWIVDGRYSGKNDTWEYCNNDSMHCHRPESRYYHELEKEKIEKILATEIENCMVWILIQKRARELYYM